MATTTVQPILTTNKPPRYKHVIPRQDPVNETNLLPRIVLSPIFKCKLYTLPTLNDLLMDFRYINTLYEHGNTKIVHGKWKNIGYCVCKTFNIYDVNLKNMKRNIHNVWTEYQLVRYSGLMEYGLLYYDSQTDSLIIRQLSYKHTLHTFIARNGPLKTNENRVKMIVIDVLKKLWILHNCNFVHRDIKPGNIMEREMDHILSSDWIKDGWLLIDFSDARRVNTKGSYAGTIGWTAPEIDFNSNQNVYHYSCDIFSFGLVILFILTGHQPLELPLEEMEKYSKGNDKRGMIRKQVHSNWYYGNVVNGENMVKHYLIDLYNDKKISYPLFKLLFEGMLLYDANKRWNCKQIYYSEWFKDVNA